MPKLTTPLKLPKATRMIPTLALRSVTSRTGNGVYASSDTLFKGAIFGRDSLEVAEDLLASKPQLVKRILITLAKLQGETDNPVNEEERGKIVHEYRNVVVDGKHIDATSMQIFKQLAEKWGGTDTDMAYYGSIDATPHFIRVLDAYCQAEGNKILDQTVVLYRSGKELTMREVMQRSVTWLMQHIYMSKSGLIEYQRRNNRGIENQVWKDSEEFYVHVNGQRANHKAPIASIEVQGLGYDALMAASRLLPQHTREYRLLAEKLRERTIELLWNEKLQYFALGTDFAPSGKLRSIATSTANPAALLDTTFFDELPDPLRRTYVTGLVRTITGPDFLTDAGIRSRGLSAAHVISFWDYHGSYVSWPKETYDIAKGLRRQGFELLAHELENRLLNVVLKNREYPEFVYVDAHGRVLASSPSPHQHAQVFMVDSSIKPEAIQAWTVSALIAIMNQRVLQKLKLPTKTKDTWQNRLQTELLAHIPRVKPLLIPGTLKARYPTYNYRLNGNER